MTDKINHKENLTKIVEDIISYVDAFYRVNDFTFSENLRFSKDKLNKYEMSYNNGLLSNTIKVLADAANYIEDPNTKTISSHENKRFILREMRTLLLTLNNDKTNVFLIE